MGIKSSPKARLFGGRAATAARVRAQVAGAVMASNAMVQASRNSSLRTWSQGINKHQPKNETGYLDIAFATYANDTTGSITLINPVAQGAATTQRIGKKWTMKSIQVRGFMENGATATTNNITNLIVYDKRPTGTLPAITDILNTVNSSSFNNDTNSGRFRIIRRNDEILVGGYVLATNPVLESTMKNADEFVKLNLPVVNKALGTGAIGDIEEGALYFISVGNTAAGGTAASTKLGFRLRFTE